MEDSPAGENKQSHPDTNAVYPSPAAPPAVSPAAGSDAPATPPGAATPSPVTADQSHNTHDGSHILQWLTFMFWGLTILALTFLTASVFQRLIVGEDASTFNYYVIASLVILLPLAFVCDTIYAKQEPAKKVGAASRIMAGYAIIFALFGIVALLSVAWNIVAWATGSGLDHSSSQAAIISGLLVFVYYLATFMRTLNPTHVRWIPKVYRFGVLGTVALIALLGIAKPTFHTVNTKNTSNPPSACSPDLVSGESCTQPNDQNRSENNFDSHGKLEPAVVGGTQCSIPTLSDGSTTGQVAVTGGATCSEAEANIQSATGKNGGSYKANGYTCTSTKQGSGTQWSSYWNDSFYSYSCSSGSKQTAFNLQTVAQSKSSSM